MKDRVAQLRPKDRSEVVLAICEYALNVREPELTGVPAGFFRLVKPNRADGPKPNRIQSRTKRKPNRSKEF